MTDERRLLLRTAELAADFLDTLNEREVWPPATVEELRDALGGPLPDDPIEPLEVIEGLARNAEPGLVAIPSGRYFGFVIGGAVPASLAADWLTSTWDQNAGLVVCGLPRSPRRWRGSGRRSSSRSHRQRPSPSSPAARWPMSHASRRPATRCSRTPIGTSNALGSRARRASWSSREKSAM